MSKSCAPGIIKLRRLREAVVAAWFTIFSPRKLLSRRSDRALALDVQRRWHEHSITIWCLVYERDDHKRFNLAQPKKEDASSAPDCSRMDFVVFIDPAYSIDWVADGNPESKAVSFIARAESIGAVDCAFLAHSRLVEFRIQIAHSIVCALQGELEEAETLLSQAQSYLAKRTVERSREWTLRSLYAADAVAEQRISQFQYAPDGGLKRLILQNPTTGEQVTTWVYGATLFNSDIASNSLPVQKIYPTGEVEAQTYNRQGEVKTMTDPNSSVHTYLRDSLGRLTDDQITTLASGVDGLVRRISTSYDERGRVKFITSGSDPSPGAGSIINQTAYAYNGIDCLTSEAQSDSGIVGVDTPKVQYTCTAAVNHILRRTSMVYPNGRTISYEYGDSGSVDDVLNRAQSVHDDDLSVLAEFQYLGATTPAITTMPVINVIPPP